MPLGPFPPIEPDHQPLTTGRAMGMTPYDIGKLLGHANPNRPLPWYLKENLHQLGRMYRKANPLDRTVHALLDTDAAAKVRPVSSIIWPITPRVGLVCVAI